MIRLTDQDSFPRVEDASERHMRLCFQTKNGERYANLLRSFYDDFEVKKTAYHSAVKNSTYAYDITKLRDTELDDVLRTVHGRAKEIDRDNPGSNVVNLLFPDGLSGIVSMPDKSEPEAARGIVQKINSLGTDSLLAQQVPSLESAITASDLAFEAYVATGKLAGNAQTDYEIAKIKLIKQYNASYFTAANDFGKSFAEKLYPKLYSEKKEEAQKTATA